MKKYIFIILILNLVSLYSQDNLNPRKLNYLSASSYTASSSTASIINTNAGSKSFILGWNWSDGHTKNLDEALKINTYHQGVSSPYTNFSSSFSSSSFNSILKTDIYGARNVNNNFNGMGLYLEPALDIAVSSTFKPNVEADCGSAFGFQNKNSIGSNTITGLNSSTLGCFRLFKNNLSTSSATVLSNIFPKKILNYNNFPDLVGTLFSSTIAGVNGINWYLSINLKALGLASNTLSDNTPILKIKLPYELYNIASKSFSSTFINFEKLPISSGTTTSELEQINCVTWNSSNTYTDFRGIARKMASPTFTNEFIITKGMLKIDGSNSSSFITLSGLFHCDGVQSGGIYNFNPILKPIDTENNFINDEYITSLDCEIEYFGGLDLDINWVRFETPNLQRMTRGVYDQEINSILLNVMNAGLGNASVNTSQTKLFRFYNDDELLPFEYEQTRYINMLLDTNVSSEMFYNSVPEDNIKNFMPHFQYATGFKQFWTGTNFSLIPRTYTAVPYCRIEKFSLDGKEHPEVFNFSSGYMGYAGSFLDLSYPGEPYYSSSTFMLKDTVNSMYETQFLDATSSNTWDNKQIRPIPGFNPFENASTYEYFNTEQKGDFHTVARTNSIQQSFDSYLNFTMKGTPSSYYNTQHWVNLWLGENYELANCSRTFQSSASFTTLSCVRDQTRPVTGEELRLSMSSEVLKGTKGFLVWSSTARTFSSSTFEFDSGRSGLFYDIDGNSSTTAYTHYAGLQGSRFSSSLTGYNLIYSDEIGGDFVKLSNDPDYYDNFYKPGELYSSSNTLGKLSSTFYDLEKLYVKPERVYIGRMSQRAELYKYFSFIKENESLLTDVNLLAYKNKGFISFSNQHPSSTISINDIIDTINIKTRPIGREKDGLPYYENSTTISGIVVDSSFYEVSILANNNMIYGSPNSNTFCISIVNRRTDPLIQNEYSHDGSDYNEMQFYTSAEYDQNVLSGSHNDLYGVSRTFTWWQKKWWKRLGCREISVPLKYKYISNGVEKYALLKITELKGNEKPLHDYLVSSSFSNVDATVDKLYPRVDKIIGQDGSIVANYLPGEGKIFKVQILPPAELTGKLDNINQNKMVSMPVYSSGTLTNKIVYYATYYDYHKQYKTNVVRLAISMPIDKNSTNSDIDWVNFSSSTISNNLLFTSTSPTFTINPSSSGTFYNSYHPTIAVRQDPSNANLHSIFVLYSVKRPKPFSADSLITIAEANLTFDPSNYSITSNYNHEIHTVKFSSTQSSIDWGTPTINSAKDVLFYAWSGIDNSSGTQGIFYTYKNPSNTLTGPIKSISSTTFPDWNNTYSTMLHPSLNTYSTTISSNQATLVWDQDKCSNGQLSDRRLIYMTNLYYNPTLSNTFGYFLNSLNPSSTFKDGMYFYDNNNIVKFNWGGSAGIYPSVYSNLSILNGNMLSEKVSDYIIFERRWDDGVSRVFLLPIGFVNPTKWDVKSPLITIMGKNSTYNLKEPVIKQPSSLVTDPSVPATFKQSRFLINFLLDSYVSALYQISLDEGSAIGSLVLQGTAWKGIYSTAKNIYDINKITGNSRQNHLASSPLLNYDPSAWKNRRLFETGDNTILTSARYFYKQNSDGLEIESYFGYTTDTTSFYIGELNKDNSLLPMKLPYSINLDSVNGNTINYNNSDSIYSDWFTVSSSANIDFKVSGYNVPNCEVFIERRDSAYTYSIPTTLTGADTLANLISVVLINGMGKDYRLVVRKIDTLNIYEEQVVLGGKQMVDTIYYKGSKTKVKLIDLSNGTGFNSDKISLLIHPTPASDEVFVNATIPFNLMNDYENRTMLLKVYSPTGILLDEFETYSGSTIGLNTKNYLTGVYLLKIDMKESRDNSTAVYSKIVIQK